MRAAVDQIRDYGVSVGKTLFMTRRGFLGLVLAILPFGKPKQILLEDG